MVVLSQWRSKTTTANLLSGLYKVSLQALSSWRSGKSLSYFYPLGCRNSHCFSSICTCLELWHFFFDIGIFCVGTLMITLGMSFWVQPLCTLPILLLNSVSPWPTVRVLFELSLTCAWRCQRANFGLGSQSAPVFVFLWVQTFFEVRQQPLLTPEWETCWLAGWSPCQ